MDILDAGPEDKGQRLDRYLTIKFPDYSRSYFNKLIKNNLVLVNNLPVKSGYIIDTGDRITIDFIREEINLQPQDIPLNIVYEDEHIMVINKPAGLTVHPGKGQPDGTMVNALLFHTDQLGTNSDEQRPGIVHRLDKNTSGLIVAAKTDKALRGLQTQFQHKQISRIYWALVWGVPDKSEGMIHSFINRSRKDPTKMMVTNKGREAITHYKLLQSFEYMSLLEVRLETGRTHQIRVHMNHIHHPVVGDPDYHGRDSQLKRLPVSLQKRGQHLLNMLDHQALHAKTLHLIHPQTNQPMTFESELPEQFATALQKIPHLFLLTE
ncbi:MAG: RluA family pseudouridine synthase [Calditrichaceae bacterium]|nr:RluA family pseudouridine synthase [Calditrichaceae bacterium]MBN2708234.1 RluA family pseudouridine synthase [Calditrichaceae bacterium]RQV92257.1 MAG: RluA family pseudouridine synthase [Calditrichota bacterium]